MKKLEDLRIAKEAILSDVEASDKGGFYYSGSNTSYIGPDNPSSLQTSVDGGPLFEDGSSGTIAGDTWECAFNHAAPNGTVFIKKG